MKKILLSFMALMTALTLFGQQQLPNDPAVRVGKLENGMTYYIRHNALPAQRAEFYLATDVGAFQETDDQDGLAHFLEHMCFNGTKNFPGKGILDYLQSIGAEFGRNINASTGFEQTQYMLNNIPIIREGIIDTCLLIMHDYSHFVTCDPEEIDAERGVILEERRSRRSAAWRMQEQSFPYIYGDTPYAKRTLIGGEEQLKTFAHESLTNFYKTWYQPDMQALIVVGDFDVDQMEAKIKATFSDIPAPAVPTKKELHKIPDNDEPVIAILSDPEATSSSIEILWKSEPMPKEYNSTDVGVMMQLMKNVISMVMRERFTDITSEPGAPFMNAYLYMGQMCTTMEVTGADVSFKDGESLPAFKALMTELEKLKRYGVTDAEVDRAKAEIISRCEQEVEGADTRKNASLVGPLMDNFFFNTSYMEPATELEVVKAIFSQLSAPLINQVLAQVFTDNNIVIISKAPQKEGLKQPTEDELKAILAEVKTAEIEANAAETANEPLLDASKLKGSKVKKEYEGIHGSTVWELKNGVKVVVLPTEHKKDQVMINFYKRGGRTLIATEDLPSFDGNIWYTYLGNKGVSKFSESQLNKMLSGKQVYCNPYIGEYNHGINAWSTPKDLETAFQLIYLNFADQRFDADAFKTGIDQINAVLPNLLNQPNFKFQALWNKSLYGDNPRRGFISQEMMAKADLATIERVYRELFNDAAGSVITIVGNVDMETLKPLVQKYIGSIKKGKKPFTVEDRGDAMVDYDVNNHIAVPMETPKATVALSYSVYMPYSVKDDVLADAAKYALDMIYTETLRESEGGTYGAQVMASLVREPQKDRAKVTVLFETNPESAEKLTEMAKEGIRTLADEGISDDKMNKLVENFKKNVPESRISNDYWQMCVNQWLRYGIDYDAEYEAAVNSLSEEELKAFVSELLKKGNLIEVVVTPETK